MGYENLKWKKLMLGTLKGMCHKMLWAGPRLKKIFAKNFSDFTFLNAFTHKSVTFCTCADVLNIFSLSCWRENKLWRLCLLLWKHIFWKALDHFYAASWFCHWWIFDFHPSLDGGKITQFFAHVMDGLQNKFQYRIIAGFWSKFYSNRRLRVCRNKHYEEGFSKDLHN